MESNIFNSLLSKIEELRLPSKSWGTHFSNEKLILLSVKPGFMDTFEVFKCVTISGSNKGSKLQINTSVFQFPITVPYINYEIKNIVDLQCFLEKFEKVQLCKYYYNSQNENCEMFGKDFTDICCNCNTTFEIKILKQSKEVFECTVCSEKQSSLEALKCHAYVFHDKHLGYTVHSGNDDTTITETEFPCKICGSRLFSSESLTKHELIHFNGNSNCIVCSIKFNCLQKLTNHTKKYHPNVAFIKCHQCNKKFSTERNLRVHLRSHIREDKSFSCSKCILKFHTQLQLNLHEKFHKQNCFNCKKCFQKFTDKKQLLLHNLREHPKFYYTCKVCHRGFEKQIHLLTHQQSHGLQFECKRCSKYFKIYNDFVEHKIAHRSGNRYICPVCRRRFPTQDSAKKHDCKLELYTCDMCNKEFNNVHLWKRHCRRHAIQKLFECPICQQSFSTRGNLACHKLLHEKGESISAEKSTETVTASIAE